MNLKRIFLRQVGTYFIYSSFNEVFPDLLIHSCLCVVKMRVLFLIEDLEENQYFPFTIMEPVETLQPVEVVESIPYEILVLETPIWKLPIPVYEVQL